MGHIVQAPDGRWAIWAEGGSLIEGATEEELVRFLGDYARREAESDARLALAAIARFPEASRRSHYRRFYEPLVFDDEDEEKQELDERFTAKFRESWIQWAGRIDPEDPYLAFAERWLRPTCLHSSGPIEVATPKALLERVCAVTRKINPHECYDFDELHSLTDSPIELAFGFAFMVAGIGLCSRPVSLGKSPNDYWLCPQHEIGEYRVDFLVGKTLTKTEHDHRTQKDIELHFETQIVVECDGHDFHERTKEQAKKDRQRDRELQRCGFPVFRFTGSEIYADAFQCAQQILDYLNEREMDYKMKNEPIWIRAAEAKAERENSEDATS